MKQLNNALKLDYLDHIQEFHYNIQTFPSISQQKQKILEILDNDKLNTYFQPIYSIVNGNILGNEALTRLQDDNSLNTYQLFKIALLTNTLSILNIRCLENTIKKAYKYNIYQTNQLLFINISPDVFFDKAYSIDIILKIINSYPIKKENIVFEITEERHYNNQNKDISDIIEEYKKAGFKIAIDDFGRGSNALIMLSTIPDFIKIDKNFIKNIDVNITKRLIVEELTILCHKMGIKVIAEGIEREEELKILQSIGVDFGQGFLLSKPKEKPTLKNLSIYKTDITNYTKCEINTIFDITTYIEPLTPEQSILEANKKFFENQKISLIPIVENDRILGILQRQRFLENKLLGKLGFGFHINAKKKIKELMEYPSIIVEANTTIEEVAQQINGREYELIYDDICVTLHGKYVGTCTISKLLQAITEQNINLAKNKNPLTGLPGNDAIRKEINKKLNLNIYFDIGYIDINNFKPYNDYYGFEKGDFVIKTIGEYLQEIVNCYSHCCINNIENYFIGHIGGDDFIIITPPNHAIQIANKLIEKVEANITKFHSIEEANKGYYVSKNRKGEIETFSLLSLSIAIINTEITKINSYAHLASLAAEVKKYAKQKHYVSKKSEIVIDRRSN